MTNVIRTTIGTLLAAAAFGVVLALSSPAQAGTGCADQIIQDWRQHKGTIAGTYPIACYRQAIAALPNDLRNYSTAADDIRRALAARLRGESDPGPATTGDSSSGGAPAAGGGGDDGGSPTREPAGGTPGDGQPETSGAEPATPEAGPGEPSGEVAAPSNEAFDRDLGDGSSSLPTPVIALIAVAGALALAGCAWLVRRQLARR